MSNMTLSTFQKQVAAWGTKTFPDATPETIADHLAEEMIELLGTHRVKQALKRALEAEEIYEDDVDICPASNPAEESADILLMMLHLAYRFDFDLMEEAQKKFAHVRDAEWVDDGRGYKKRVKP